MVGVPIKDKTSSFLPLLSGLFLVALTTCGKDSPTGSKSPDPPPPAASVATRIVISPSSSTLNAIGQTVQLTASVFDQYNSPMPSAVVSWSSNSQEIATVSVQGLVTAVKNGATVITARSGNVSATANVTVSQAAVRIEIKPGEATLMSIGATVQLTATVLDQNFQPVEGAVLTWQSGDETVAAVSAQGLVTAVGNGVARITATSGSTSSGIEVRVMQEAGSIVIEPMEATLMSLGETVQLTATVLDQNGQAVVGAVLTWQSGDETVATVGAQGLVTAVGNGAAWITATSGSTSSGIEVRVMQEAGSIVIEPMEATLMSLGETVQLTATVLDQNGQAVVGAVLTWQSGDETVATVGAQGLVTAVGNGVARITASSGSTSDSIEVKVEVHGPSPDREALVAIFNATSGPDWINNTNWLSDKHVEEWYGVNTGEAGRVTALNLGSNNLNGALPIQLAKLNYLEGLSLESNELAGSIPQELGELTNLTHLYLFDNRLTGDIAPELGHLYNLIHLCLNNNQLEGSIPPELGRLGNLKWLHLHNNANLTGALPGELAGLDLDALLLQDTQVCLTDNPELERWFSEIPDARIEANCEDFDIERVALNALYNATDGPNWRNNTNWLSDKPLDQWHGVQTDEAGRIIGLKLRNNRLSGTIPTILGQLKNLTVLDLAYNQLTDSIPVELWQMTNLTRLSLDGNQLSGELPEGLSQLGKLKVLGLSRNFLTGSVPAELANMKNLVSIELYRNHFTGSIPASLGNLDNLSILNLHENQLSGSIPYELGNLRNLHELFLGDNKLSGELPAELGKLTNLVWLSLKNNLVSGSIPAEFGNLSKLQFLILRQNRLSGSIPAELGGLTSLRELMLIQNRLTGTIPPKLGQITNLGRLGLGSNRFLASPLPIELTAMRNLDYLNLQNSNLCVPDNADFHAWLETIEIVWPFTFCSNPERDALVALYHATGGQNWIDNTNWASDRPLHDWSGVSTDTASRVEHLNLENNNLSGVVPDALAELTELKSLDLRENPSLAGALPNALVKLSLELMSLEGTQVCAPVDAAFQAWLLTVTERSGIANCVEIQAADDRMALERLYHQSNGYNWYSDENWLSTKPLGEWHGVTTDAQGRVIGLELPSNNLFGTIPPDLGRMTNLKVLNLYGNSLAGSIPTELGQLTNLKILILWNNDLSGSIPPELGKLGNLLELNLTGNKLTGSIPVEIGELINLTALEFTFNSLTGSIPAELGNLTDLEYMSFLGNELSGVIPPEFRQLVNLEYLDLSQNNLNASLPPELGELTELTELRIHHAKLSGSIPAELAKLTNLQGLYLHFNNLTGGIPSELGLLSNLKALNLTSNHLSGVLPPELGDLSNLHQLLLSENQLSGELPADLAGLFNLKELDLRGNEALTGPMPRLFIRLHLNTLRVEATQLCAPRDTEFQEWLGNIQNLDFIAECPLAPMNPVVYLTQAVQSFDRPVPLIEGKPALLRVFFTTDEVVLNRPTVRATFYLNGAEVHSAVIPSGAAKIPLEIDEGSLELSANAEVPASVIVEGLELVVEIEPHDKLDSDSGIGMRIPASGRMSIKILAVPPFDLTLVPLVWSEDPDFTVVTESAGLTADDALFRLSRDLYPISDFRVFLNDPLMVSLDPVFQNSFELLKEVLAFQKMDGKGGHYMGIVKDGGLGGRPTNVFLSELSDYTIAHELGHNLSLSHAPCGGVDGWDNYFPYPKGNIGAWGYDILTGSLIDPGTPDILSYCYPPAWISDYHFIKALQYRRSERYRDVVAPASASKGTRTLLLWGGLGEYGELSLEPAFVVRAHASLPKESGPYRLVGEDFSVNTLFDFTFDITELSQGEGGVFAFLIPVRADWIGRLAQITLSGPQGIVEMRGNGERTAALLLDRSTHEIKGILRDWPAKDMTEQRAGSMLPEPGLEVIVSPGIPDPSDR